MNKYVRKQIFAVLTRDGLPHRLRAEKLFTSHIIYQ